LHPTLSRLLFYPTFSWNYVLGRVIRVRHWWDSVDEHVLLGARPLRSDVRRLYDLGVRGIINMCQEYAGPTDRYQSLGMVQLWLPTIDFNPPSLEHVKLGVDFLQEHTSRSMFIAKPDELAAQPLSSVGWSSIVG
jgi:atypical dual specificity phosphatase